MSKSKPKASKKIKKAAKLIKTPKYQSIAAIIVIIAAAILGYFLFINSHAASPFTNTEAESGTLAGSACKVTNTTSGASGNAFVSFGGSNCSTTTGNSLCGFKTGTPT